MNNTIISVIVPCYNQAEFMDECLQSVLDQTYQDWECIIVNDGSPDHTEEIAKNWVEKDSRFKYLYKENGGLSSARNAGIESAKGEWILPLDCDDKIGNEYLFLASQEFYKNPTIIYCEAYFFGITNEKWQLSEFNFSNFIFGNQIFCSAFFKRNLWEKVNGYDEKLVNGREDWEFWLAILSQNLNNHLVLKLPYVGFFYRRKANSMDVIINADSDKMFFSELYIYNKHAELYKNFGSPTQNIRKIEKLKIVESKYLNLLKIIRKSKISKLLFKLIERI